MATSERVDARVDDLAEVVAGWRAAGLRVALATVIKVDGSAPRDEGAKMAIAEDGRIAGSVSGGCVEGAVAEAASGVIASGTPAIARYGLTRQMMWDVGLSCGGAIDVFIEPLGELSIADVDGAGAICTVVRGPASSIGRKLAIKSDGAVRGSLGDPALDAAVTARALSIVKSGSSQTVAEGAHEIFVDVSLAPPQAILVGAVHIAIALCRMASIAGFMVTVIDPRPLLCNRERFPDAHRLVVEWPDDALATMALDDNAYVAVLTHDEKFDDPSLLRALPSRARYVGAIGSKKTQGLRRERLRAAGLTEEAIARLHGPIGLAIGAQSPEEIAVAILAEMVAARRG